MITGDAIRLTFEEVTDQARVVWSDAGEAWTKSGSRMIRDLLETGIGTLDLGVGPRQSQSRRLEFICDVSLVWSNFLIKDGLYCPIYDEDTRHAVSSLLEWPGMAHVAGVFRSRDDFVVSRTRLREANRIDGPILLASTNEPSNWGRWLMTIPYFNGRGLRPTRLRQRVSCEERTCAGRPWCGSRARRHCQHDRHLACAAPASLTWDQGAEMAQHAQLRIDAGVAVHFCDPHNLWQRGTNENTHGLLRQYFPKGTDLSLHSADDLAALAPAMNVRPRKTLGWRTPAETFDALLRSDHTGAATTG